MSHHCLNLSEIFVSYVTVVKLMMKQMNVFKSKFIY